VTGCVVELLGLPGAGKTHVAGLLSAALARRGVPVRAGGADVAAQVPAPVRLPRKLALVGAAGLACPSGSGRVVRRIADSGQSERADVLGRSVQWLVTQGLLQRARGSDDVHVFDEGVLQALWSIGLRGDPWGLCDLLARDPRCWQAPDLVVVVEAPLDVVGARLASRSSLHSRVQEVGAAALGRELARGRALVDALAAWWLRVSGAAPVRVTNPDGSLAPGALDAVLDRVEVSDSSRPRRRAGRSGRAGAARGPRPRPAPSR
jgi:hypothetical protein